MGGEPVGYLHSVVEELNSGLPRTIEPGTSGFQIQCPKPPGHAVSLHSASEFPNFLVNGSLNLYIGDGRNNVAFFIGKILHQTPIKRAVISDCSRFWKPQICHSNNQNSLPPLPPNILFCHSDSGWSCDQPQPDSFFQRTKEEEEREPEYKLAKQVQTLYR